MIRNSVPLFFIFSLTATLLLPSSTHHVNFSTWSVLQGKKDSNSGSATATATAKIVDKDCSSRSVVARSLLGTESTDRSANQTVIVSTTDNATTTVCSRYNRSATCTANSTASASAPLSNPRQSPSSPRNSSLPLQSSPRHSPLPSGLVPLVPSPLSSALVPPPTLLSPSPSPAFTPTLVSGNHIFWRTKVVIGVATGVMGGFTIFIIICCFRYKSLSRLFKFCSTTESNLDIEAFLELHGAVAQKRYRFSEVKKMTNSFKDKLGQGGFGAVYKGNLPTGSPVAVKILNASKRNGEEFINEVASISRTSHVNIVTLLGFCLEGRRKALIYEFMVNGSLEKFIYKREPQTIASLSWENLYQISTGIARGLEYLHRGCNTRILHFDIKPHNILLDENFCPKISDFGLAKLCPRKESIISMKETRGTMGYVAPEMFNRQFGGVSHKSDVYSYGMMLLEMVGGRRNINAEASHTSEIYFPYLVYNRLELDNDLRPDEVMSTKENEIAKRMTIVGLWCIQTFPNDRPTMSRVVEMLEGSMNSLEKPPKPMFSSPTRSATESSSSN